MIGITISGEAYIAVVSALSARSFAETKVVLDRQYRLWLPGDVVVRLRALRHPGESFSGVILRLAARGSLAAIAR
jgi:predicted CopG family antitoxin